MVKVLLGVMRLNRTYVSPSFGELGSLSSGRLLLHHLSSLLV